MDTSDDAASVIPQVVVPLNELGDELADELGHDNYGPSVGACVWALATLAAGWLALRLYLKFRKHWGLWWDDHFLTIPLLNLRMIPPPKERLLTFNIEVVATSVAISLGWGQQPYDIAPKIMPHILLALFISGLFSILAAAISKTSFALTLLRISSGWIKYTIWFAIVTINIAMSLSLIFNWVQCTPVEKNFNFSVPGSCWPRETLIGYNTFATAYSGAMDILLALLPWKIIWNMDMSRKERFGAICAMSLGIFAGTIALAKIYALIGTFQANLNSSVQLVVLSIAESAVTIMAASIPILRALARDRAGLRGVKLFTLNVTEHLTLRRLSDSELDIPVGENGKTSEASKGSFKVVRKASGKRAPALSKIIEGDEPSPGLLRGTGERSFVVNKLQKQNKYLVSVLV
ncbi:hypothetical protein GQX73_g10345 [Xylaria multiplex]|uniref:Rhodopsin domain-containing protein n=1 Tax=Xylaria multiplex TaxID=323545 RepID=A0A7C8IKC4_9PEZI|nr:hypothetical protein GQX73_g10345 [Xylaria multiplex]